MLGPLFDDSIAIRCRKSAHRCGAKHTSKSKVLKGAGSTPILRCQLTNLTDFSHSTNNYNNYNNYYNYCNYYNYYTYNNYNDYYNYNN